MVGRSSRSAPAAMPAAELPHELPVEAWSAGQRLLALQQAHGLSGSDLHAWCREKGLFEHQLIAWRDVFCRVAAPESRESKLVLRELQTRNDMLQRALRRKEKSLAEAAALLVLQKKLQALWEDEETWARSASVKLCWPCSAEACDAGRAAGTGVHPDRPERAHRTALATTCGLARWRPANERQTHRLAPAEPALARPDARPRWRWSTAKYSRICRPVSDRAALGRPRQVCGQRIDPVLIAARCRPTDAPSCRTCAAPAQPPACTGGLQARPDLLLGRRSTTVKAPIGPASC